MLRQVAWSKRSTPACAGSTSPCRAGCGSATVHPRVRGEYQTLESFKHLYGGPPPRARGVH